MAANPFMNLPKKAEIFERQPGMPEVLKTAGLPDVELPGFFSDVQKSSERFGLGLIDLFADVAPEAAAKSFGWLTGREITPEELQSVRDQAIAQNRESMEGRGFIESLPGRIAGDPTSLLKMTPGVGGGVGGLTEPTLESESRALNTALGVAGGKLVGQAMKGSGNLASRYIAKAIPQKNVTPQMTADMIKDASGNAYRAARETGGIIKSERVAKFIDDLGSLRKKTPEGKLITGENISDQLIEAFGQLRGRPLTLDAIQEIDEGLTERASDLFTTNPGQFRAVKQIQNQFRQMVSGANEADVLGGKDGFDALAKGRKLWSQQAKMNDLEKIIMYAENMENPVTGIKTRMNRLLRDDKKIGAYTTEEKKAIAKAAKTGIIDDVLKTAGSRLMGIIGLSTNDPLTGVALQAGSTGSRKAAEAIKMEQANKVAEAISDEAIRAMGGKAPMRKLPIGSMAENLLGGAVDKGAIQVGRESAVQSDVSNQPTATDNPFMNLQPTVVPEFIPDTVVPEIIPDTTNPVGMDTIKQHEGLRLSSYDDTVGKRTVGYGFNMQSGIARKVWERAGVQSDFVDVFKGRDTISQQEAQALLQASYDVAADDARKVYGNFDRLSPSRQQALLSMSYQLGLPKLKKFTTFNKAIERGDYNTAITALRKTKLAQQTPNRVAEISQLLLRSN